MFQKENLLKHYIFAFVDIVALMMALICANYIRFHGFNLRLYNGLYIETFYVSIFGCLMGNLLFHLDKRIFDRGFFLELKSVIQSTLCIAVSVLIYLYVTQRGIDYSRLQLFLYFLIYCILDYIIHIIMKIVISKKYLESRGCRKIMLVTTSDRVESVISKIRETNNWYFRIEYIVLLDQEAKGKEIHGIPVIANRNDMIDISKTIALDGVFLNISYRTDVDIEQILHDFQDMGVVVHININAMEIDVSEKVIESLGDFLVVSYASRLFEPGQLLVKRLMDILGSFIGLIITAAVLVFVGPAIFIESPGPIFFKQVRVGKNGRKFQMYKFRSMYMDAEERKKDLIERNQMQGAIFKIKDDPRVTKVGKFIRKYSIDELPQFFNVLKGDMSLVGTRPPIESEVEKYENSQKRRLSVTPGMTGMWQTSGRSEIYDFDEIVKLDLEYIDKWSIMLDIKLLFKTIIVCLKGIGAE